MFMALLWLSVSAPFVFENQKKYDENLKCWSSQFPFPGSEEESSNPAGNTTEEKIPKSLNSFSEEYLHDNHWSNYISSINLRNFHNQDAGIYIAYHGDLLVPPPDVA